MKLLSQGWWSDRGKPRRHKGEIKFLGLFWVPSNRLTRLFWLPEIHDMGDGKESSFYVMRLRLAAENESEKIAPDAFDSMSEIISPEEYRDFMDRAEEHPEEYL